MASLAQIFSRLHRVPFGDRLFSRAVTWRAPYFATISPRFIELREGHCAVAIRNRRRVHNHLGGVNAIAMCAMCELAAGTMLESSLPRALRWIPRGMSVRYLKRADTDLVALAELPDPIASDYHGDLIVPVRVRNSAGEAVMEADICMYLSPRQPSQPAAAA